MDVIDRRSLGRATLARQHLLTRVGPSAPSPALAVVERLVGMQAQAPFSPYFGLWARVDGFAPDHLAVPLVDRRVVRIQLMRGTIHLVTADDALWLRPLVQPLYDQDLALGSQPGGPLAGLDVARLAAVTRAAVEEAPRTNPELTPVLAAEWPDHDPTALVRAARLVVPLVQVPPRAVWGRSGQARVTTVEAWLGRPQGPAPSERPTAAHAGRLVERYLAAFGPASVADVQLWAGLTRLREVVDDLAGRLRPFRDEDGRELWDLPEAPRPGPDVAAPVRFLPEFDNLLRSHDDRRRVLDEDRRKALLRPNGVPPHAFLVDGRVAGTWRLTETKASRKASAPAPATASVEVTPFAALAAADAAAVEDEAAALLVAAYPDATHDVRLLPPA